MSNTLNKVADDLVEFFSNKSEHVKELNGQWHAAALLDGRRALYRGYNHPRLLQQCCFEKGNNITCRDACDPSVY
jgi:hypothetical protein